MGYVTDKSRAKPGVRHLEGDSGNCLQDRVCLRLSFGYAPHRPAPLHAGSGAVNGTGATGPHPPYPQASREGATLLLHQIHLSPPLDTHGVTWVILEPITMSPTGNVITGLTLSLQVHLGVRNKGVGGRSAPRKSRH